MKKSTILIALIALCASLQAQSFTYRIDTIRTDSFYLVERATTVTENSPRPSTAESYQLFRSKEQVTNFVDYLRKQALESEKQAADAEKKVQELKAAQKRLEAAANSIEKAIKDVSPFFDGQKPPAKKPPTKKGKKQ